jgi:ADP-ribose pyrophosphatase
MSPIYFDEPIVSANSGPGGWADATHVPSDELKERFMWWNNELIAMEHCGVEFDENDKPINPYAPSDPRLGRHMLGKWGPNHAADPIITRDGRYSFSPKEILVVKRKPQKDVPDDKLFALPGGFVEAGEEFKTAALREAFEEAVEKDVELKELFDRNAVRVYTGYVEDPRCTRNAWIETCTFHLHLTHEQGGRLSVKHQGDGEETTGAFWAPLVSQTFDSMYSHHPLRVKEACVVKGWIVPETCYTHYAEQAMETFYNVKTLILMASILVAFTSFKSIK